MLAFLADGQRPDTMAASADMARFFAESFERRTGTAVRLEAVGGVDAAQRVKDGADGADNGAHGRTTRGTAQSSQPAAPRPHRRVDLAL